MTQVSSRRDISWKGHRQFMEKLALEMGLFRIILMRNTGHVLVIQGFPTKPALAEPWEWRLAHKQECLIDAKWVWADESDPLLTKAKVVAI